MASNRRVVIEFLGNDKSASATAGKVDSRFSKLSSTLGKVAKVGALAGVAIAGAAAKFGVDAVGKASDLNETLSKSNAIFGKNAAAMEKWAAGGAKTMGLSKNAALGAAAGFGDMFTQIGFAGDQAAKMSKSVVQMSADLGSFNNLETADVADRMSAAFRGEYDSLQQVIPNINAARVESEALAATGKTVAKELTAQEKAAAVLAIVHKDGARAMGDFKRTSGGLANQQKILKAQFENVQASIGQKLLPVAVKLATWFNDSLIPAISATWTWLSAKLGPVFTAVGGWIKGTLVPAIQSLIERFKGANSGMSTVKKALRDAQPFFKLVWSAVKGLGTVFTTVLWPAIKQIAKVAIPLIQTQLRILGKGLGLVGKAGIFLWNNALGPAFKFIVKGVGGLMTMWGKMLRALGKVPGFGWAKKAGDAMLSAGRDATTLSDKIKRIPDSHKTKISTPGLGAASNGVANYGDLLRSLPREIRTNIITTRINKVENQLGRNGGFFAKGGRFAGGAPIVVGEEGPELLFPDKGGYIANATDTKRLMSGGGLSSGGGTSGGGGGHYTVDLRLDGKVIQRLLLTEKRRNGGLELGLA